MTKKLTIDDFREIKKQKIPVAAVVLYEKWMAKEAEKANIDWFLAGDSVNMAIYGEKSTAINPPTMECMLKHIKAVRDGAPHTFIIGDMPEGSYGNRPKGSYGKYIWDGAFNAKRFIKESGADAIKLEGGIQLAAQIREIVKRDVPVMGHIGLTPQTAPMEKWGNVYGETAEEAKKLLEDAQALQEAGAFAVLLEKVAEETVRIITEKLEIPVFGIGAGRHCDGQLLLSCDMLGTSSLMPKFAKCYATEKNYREFLAEINLLNQKRCQINKKLIQPTVARFARFCFAKYINEIKNGEFPQEKHIYHMKDEEYEKLLSLLK